MSYTLRSALLFIEPPAVTPSSGYAPMDVIWLFSLLLCALGTLPFDILLLGIR